MPTFQDSESAFVVVPEDDYTLTVYDFNIGLSKGDKTRGCERYEITFNIDGTDSRLKETLIDHPSCVWKIDTFLKACGIRGLKKGDEFDFNKERAEERGVRPLNPMGLRCHAHVVIDEYVTSNGNRRTKNKVSMFYTDRKAPPPDEALRAKQVSFKSSNDL